MVGWHKIEAELCDPNIENKWEIAIRGKLSQNPNQKAF